jgi:TonB-linked SusC/RagA family outer membrane protein
MKIIDTLVRSLFPLRQKKLLMILKISVILNLFFVMAFSSPSFSQEENITIEARNSTVKSILKDIETQSGLRFFYNDELRDINQEVDLIVKNEKVDNVLKKLFANSEISYTYLENKIVVVAPKRILEKQQNIIRGTITDSDSGEPLPGVNVLVEGTSIGTITDMEGKYSIEVPDANSFLTFSFIGYLSETMEVGSRSVVDISLVLNIEELNEVIVVGYGTQIKRNVTGSVSKVDVEQLESQPNTNIAQAMRGRVAGVQFMDNGRPGQSGDILIRGQRSITASNDPLVIVDGALYPVDFDEGGLAMLNPNDIESMEILKDASAAAIYGSRAANGVILITTKSGTTEKPTIRFNTFFGVSNWSHKLKLYSPESYLQRKIDFLEQNDIDLSETNPYDLEEFELERYDSALTIDPWEVISQDAWQQSYNLSVSGKTNKTLYYLSGNLSNEKGLILNDKAKRLSVRMNLENKVTDWLSIGVNSQFAQLDKTGVNASLRNAYWLSPYAKLYADEEETELHYYPTYGETLVTNPLWDATIMDNEEVSNELFANIFALVDIPFIKGLTYRLNYNPNIRWERDYSFTPIYDQEGVKSSGSARKKNTNRWDWQLENILTYVKEFENHAFKLTLVYGVDHSEWESTKVDVKGFTNDNNGWNNLSLAEPTIPETKAEQRNGVSSMARLNYRFRERYLLTATIRRDGSSIFGENNKYGVFPSISAGWIITGEPWFQTTFLDLLKFRISYGKVGNQDLDAYSAYGESGIVNYVFGDGSPTYKAIYPDPEKMPNENLKWESTISANFAIDFSTLNNRLSGTIEYYTMESDDLLLYRRLPDMTGFEGIYTNLGQTKNKGVELTLNSVNISNSNFQWSSSFVFSTNKNEITRLYGSDMDGDGKDDDDPINKWFVGHPIDVNYDYVFDGIFQEDDELPEGYQAGWAKVLNSNGDTLISPEDREVLSQRQPKIRWGLNNSFSFKGITLSFFINGMHGFEEENNLLDVSSIRGNSFPERSVNSLDAGYWTPENRSNTRPGLTYTNPTAMGYYQSRSFVRIQDVTLAYDLPSSVLEKIKIASLRVYISGRNLATFTDWQGPDPESGYNNINRLYPTSRTFVMGLNLSF